LGDDVENVSNIGFAVAKDGGVSFFAELEKSSDKQKERIEETREKKRTEKKEEEKKAEKERQKERLEGNSNTNNQWQNVGIKRMSVQADSIEELVEKIKSADWDAIKVENKLESGGKFDFSI
jgi:predicted Zn-dependent peptidase